MRAFACMKYDEIIELANERLAEIESVHDRVDTGNALHRWGLRNDYHKLLPWLFRKPGTLGDIISESGFTKCSQYSWDRQKLNMLINLAESNEHLCSQRIYLDDEAVLLLTTPIK